VVASFPSDVTAVIPSVPPRAHVLVQALESVTAQSRSVRGISIAVDTQREGSAVTRTRALAAADTSWVAFLDDDDLWLPHHIETLLDHAERTGADVVYTNCIVTNEANEVVWNPFGQPFDPELLFVRPYITVTMLVRTELAQRVKFTNEWDEWGFQQRAFRAGAQFTHVPEVTWIWRHNRHNTSGQPDRW